MRFLIQYFSAFAETWFTETEVSSRDQAESQLKTCQYLEPKKIWRIKVEV